MSNRIDYTRQLQTMLQHQQEVVLPADSGSAVSIELGAVFAKILLEPDFPFPMPQMPGSNRIIDRYGHTRPIYRPLLGYALMQAMVRARQKPIVSPGELEPFDWPHDVLPAHLAEPAAIACWNALTLYVAKMDVARNTFDQLIACQQKNGGFLLARPSDSPDMRWYHELVLLHAISSYAAQSGDPAVAAAVRRNALFHLEESQPDHATNQPWGLFAFIWVEEARPLADQMLHTVQTQHPNGIGGVAAILLADALLCLDCVADRLP